MGISDNYKLPLVYLYKGLIIDVLQAVGYTLILKDRLKISFKESAMNTSRSLSTSSPISSTPILDFFGAF